jgi:hypothetical protein
VFGFFWSVGVRWAGGAGPFDRCQSVSPPAPIGGSRRLPAECTLRIIHAHPVSCLVSYYPPPLRCKENCSLSASTFSGRIPHNLLKHLSPRLWGGFENGRAIGRSQIIVMSDLKGIGRSERNLSDFWIRRLCVCDGTTNGGEAASSRR